MDGASKDLKDKIKMETHVMGILGISQDKIVDSNSGHGRLVYQLLRGESHHRLRWRSTTLVPVRRDRSGAANLDTLLGSRRWSI